MHIYISTFKKSGAKNIYTLKKWSKKYLYFKKRYNEVKAKYYLYFKKRYNEVKAKYYLYFKKVEQKIIYPGKVRQAEGDFNKRSFLILNL
jgi:hypothetical protein